MSPLLEDLGTPLPQMGGERWAALAQIINAPAGHAFDTAYMATEYEDHAYLRDLAAAYLRNSRCAPTPGEHYGRQFAQAALSAFTEHTGIAHSILRELGDMTELSPATKTPGVSRRDVLVRERCDCRRRQSRSEPLSTQMTADRI